MLTHAEKRQRDAEAMLARNDASSSKSYIMRMKVEAEKSIVSDIFVESSKFDSVIKREAKDSQLRALAPIGILCPLYNSEGDQ